MMNFFVPEGTSRRLSHFMFLDGSGATISGGSIASQLTTVNKLSFWGGPSLKTDCLETAMSHRYLRHVCLARCVPSIEQTRLNPGDGFTPLHPSPIW
jgi:hypothetical protein